MKTLKKSILFVLLFVPAMIFAQNQKEVLASVKFEHLRINVADKAATAKWYVDNVGLEIIPSKNKEVVYVADKDHNFMIEFSQIPGIKNKYFDVPIDGWHLAFEGAQSIEEVAAKMLANGGVEEGKLYKNLIGDFVRNVRNPDGITSQQIYRVNPFFSKPVKSNVRFEHFAFNTPDQKIAALWYVEFMDLNIPWSKDIDTTKNNYRNYRVPYVGDAGLNMSMELFGKPEVPMTLAQMKHEEVHLGFLVDEPEKLAKLMIYGGAKKVGDIKKEKNGDIMIDLIDPYGFPFRLIKRAKPILVK